MTRESTLRSLLPIVILVCGLLSPAQAQFSQQGPKRVGTGAAGVAGQGYFVAVSADGNTAAVAGFGDNGGAGAVWVWIRSGGVWTQQGSKLVGSGAVGSAGQGASVALSADGNTLLVGGFLDSGSTGAAWVWTRSGVVWTQQGSKLVGSGAVGIAQQGYYVSLSSDGDTALVGGLNDNAGVGAAWVWTRSGGIWTQQGSKLVGTGAVGIARQGISVALSGDGDTAFVGGNNDDSSAGAVWVWTRSGGVWTQQGSKLVGTGAVGDARQGYSVALSTDGNTGVVGGGSDNGGAGAMWVWTRSLGVWTQQGPKLVGTGAIGNAVQGLSVTLSGDGNRAVAGGFNDNAGAGAAWVWNRSGGVWTQAGPKLVGAGAADPANQGESVAISADGSTVIVGGNTDNSSAGAAWAFAVQPTIANGDVSGLIAAINAANANPGIDTINLASGGVYTLTAVDNSLTYYYTGPNGLPIISSQIVIIGNGATIQRSSAPGTPDFRIFEVGGGDLTLNGVTIRGGRAAKGDPAYQGGGSGIRIDGGNLLLLNSTVTANAGAPEPYPSNDGGGIFNNSGTMTVQNSTISGNTSYGGYGGGGILSYGPATIVSSAIFENRADGPPGQAGRGDAISNGFNTTTGNFILKNSILASPTQGIGLDCYNGVPVSQGHNIASDASCAFAGSGDLNNTDPLLGSLANYGSPTPIHPPLFGSPALNAVPIANCTDFAGFALTTDQRGILRPLGVACEIGSVEINPATVTLTNMTQTYTGSPLSPTVTTNPPGLSFSLSGAPDTNASSYPVTAIVTDPNYTGSASGTFIINPAPATVILSNMTQTYTGSPLSPTVTTIPPGLSFSLSGAPDTNPGSYFVTATVTDPNYTGSLSGTFLINRDLGATQRLSVLNMTNTGANNAQDICAHVYAFTPDEQMISCCSCRITRNALVSLSTKDDVIGNVLTPEVPNSVTIQLMPSDPTGPGNGGCNASLPGAQVEGLAAWRTNPHLTPDPTTGPDIIRTEIPWPTGPVNAIQRNVLAGLCGFIQANGSGYGICRSCRVGGF